MQFKKLFLLLVLCQLLSCSNKSDLTKKSTLNQKATLGLTSEREHEIREKVEDMLDTMSLSTKVKTLVGESSTPLLKHGEAISGYNIKGATTLPQQIGISCSWNPELLKTNTGYTSRMMRSLGTTLALSPMLDVSRNAKWGRMEESFGESEYLTARMGLAFIKGMQTDDLSKGVATTTKHFAGYGGKNQNDYEFLEEILMPHEVAVRLGNTQSLMPGYHAYKNIPAHASSFLLKDILRENWGYDGIVVSDYFAVKQIFTSYNYAKNKLDALVIALKNGVDLELPFGDCYQLIPEALEKNLITMEEVNTSVRRILTLKGRLGLLDGPLVINDTIALDSKSFRNRAYIAATQSIVLLKNNGILPLKNDLKKVALVGPNAASVESLLGDYTYQSLKLYWDKQPIDRHNPELITLYDGLQKAIGQEVEILYERGCDWMVKRKDPSKKAKSVIGDEREKNVVELHQDHVTDYKKAIRYAEESDIIIAAMGENRYLCGESRSRNDIRLAGEQEQFVKDLIKTGKPVVLIIFGGRPHVLTAVEKGCSAIIQAWYPGEEGGNAVADILTGKVNPSAKMTVTVPRTNEQCPIWYGQRYKNKKPLYPFGHGLSYTTFSYDEFEISDQNKTSSKWITVSCNITNTGQRDGVEIPQLYISPKGLSMPRPTLSLQGFTRVALKKGESKRVTFQVSPEQFAFYNQEMSQVIEPGTYEFLIGASSTDIKFSSLIELKGEEIKLPLKNIFFSETLIN
ncbi:glycoside hydrolase family 3 N-terminal domain-containing protein [Flammeovirga sp. SubArs3]|uniref:glycoside hydrolase family 3 N-terminal domain-containing protein n=1 Tax=Flammeovirga sp. SubArs3 TaxID=2995316 RepID=UPI00248CCFC1|nr:glycoside hydrolase family 3 N-terminal domain-containing protein [Flammeovirga sp. SubArs3]